jgi:hypothetical protein
VPPSRPPRSGRLSRFVSASAASQPVIAERKSLRSSCASAMASRASADIGSPSKSQFAAWVSRTTPASALSPCCGPSARSSGRRGSAPAQKSAW